MFTRMNNGAGGPYDPVPSDDVCCHCGQQLWETCPTGSWQFEGFCDAQCAAQHALANLRAASIYSFRNVSKDDVDIISDVLRAMSSVVAKTEHGGAHPATLKSEALHALLYRKSPMVYAALNCKID